jgi:putative nucleotidyltransferase with HDIG domain
MNVLSDPLSSVDDIVEAIRYDQAVTGEVLRLCNSAFFGLSRKVTSLNDALICLGTTKVLQLVMSVHANSMLSKKQIGYGLEPGILWKHSVAVALASSAVADFVKLPNVNLVFTAGLLHDIGKVVLNDFVAEKFAEICRLVAVDRLTFIEAEHRVLGFSHEEIGAKLGESWQLPDPIIRCIRYHHSPGKLSPPEPLVDVVYLGNVVCLLLGIGVGEDGLSTRADERVMERYSLGEQDLETIGIRTMTELQGVEALFTDVSYRGATQVAGR